MKLPIYKFTKEIDFSKFLKNHENYKIIDLYENLVSENFLIENPPIYFQEENLKKEKIKDFLKSHTENSLTFSLGNWIVFESKKELYHLVDQKTLLLLRTIRNRNLITVEEQLTLYNKRISIAGLSVGSNVLMALVRIGIGKEYNIADYDTVSIHNLNRANYYLRDIDKSKIDLIEDQIISVDPYIKLNKFSSGLNEENLEKFIKNCDLVIDAFDNFKIKIDLRKIAKKFKKPVLSGFDVSRGAMVIIERYDKEPNLNLDFYLNGMNEEEIFKPSKNPKERTEKFINIIGKEHHDQRMLESVLNVGNTLTGYPQLVVATYLTASIWAIAATDILLGKNNKSVRKYINLEKEIYFQLN